MFFCDFYGIFKSTGFVEHPRTDVSVFSSTLEFTVVIIVAWNTYLCKVFSRQSSTFPIKTDFIWFNFQSFCNGGVSFSNPVDTRCRFNVYKTLPTFYRRWNDVVSLLGKRNKYVGQYGNFYVWGKITFQNLRTLYCETVNDAVVYYHSK